MDQSWKEKYNSNTARPLRWNLNGNSWVKCNSATSLAIWVRIGREKKLDLKNKTETETSMTYRCVSRPKNPTSNFSLLFSRWMSLVSTLTNKFLECSSWNRRTEIPAYPSLKPRGIFYGVRRHSLQEYEVVVAALVVLLISLSYFNLQLVFFLALLHLAFPLTFPVDNKSSRIYLSCKKEGRGLLLSFKTTLHSFLRKDARLQL